MPTFFIIFLILLIAMYGYVGWRAMAPIDLGGGAQVAVYAALLLGILCLIVPLSLRFKGFQAGWTFTVGWIGYMVFGFISMIVVFFILRDLGWLGWLGVDRFLRGADSVADPERRRWLLNATNVGLLSAGTLATGFGWYQANKTPKVLEVEVPIAELPKALDGFRIVQISDLHAGATITREFMERVVDRVNELNGDLIALTGDLVDGSVEQLRETVEPIRRLSAPHGKFFITGNHEYYSGVELWIDEVRHLGFEVLLNEHRTIERDGWRFVLAGVTDYTGGQFSPRHESNPEAALYGAPDDTARVLLAHQPLSIYEAARVGYDLVISGHTHGGQYFPYHVLVALFQPYVAGLHKHDDTWIYVSRGTGTWGPQIRVGAPSEITVITLRHQA